MDPCACELPKVETSGGLHCLTYVLTAKPIEYISPSLRSHDHQRPGEAVLGWRSSHVAILSDLSSGPARLTGSPRLKPPSCARNEMTIVCW